MITQAMQFTKIMKEFKMSFFPSITSPESNLKLKECSKQFACIQIYFSIYSKGCKGVPTLEKYIV